jgi:hypothetical protein
MEQYNTKTTIQTLQDIMSSLTYKWHLIKQRRPRRPLPQGRKSYCFLFVHCEIVLRNSASSLILYYIRTINIHLSVLLVHFWLNRTIKGNVLISMFLLWKSGSYRRRQRHLARDFVCLK